MGFDSVSQMSMLRNMPKTVRYLENDLGAVRLKEYNIVGDGTPAALFPILTGMTELTLPEARKSERDAVKVNTLIYINDNSNDPWYIII